MPKFIRQPIEVEAFQWNGQPLETWPEWARGRLFHNGTALSLETDRGPARVNLYDWVIRHPDGRLWVNDDDYFRKNYQPS